MSESDDACRHIVGDSLKEFPTEMWQSTNMEPLHRTNYHRNKEGRGESDMSCLVPTALSIVNCLAHIPRGTKAQSNHVPPPMAPQ